MASLYDPEFFKAIEPMIPVMSKMEKPAVHDTKSRRERIKLLLGPLYAAVPPAPDVDCQVFHVEASDGYSVPIFHFVKKDSSTQGPGPAVVHMHGGGYIGGEAAMATNHLATTASRTGVQIFSVEYRLAPEHPFPTPIEDCYSALLWVHQHAAELSVDPARIGVTGESAGAGLAACLAIVARDRKVSPPLAKQILVYPMLDDRNSAPTAIDQYLTWNYVDNITGWTAYIGENAGKEGVSPYAAAARVESVEGLPPTYMDVGGLDHFKMENIQYASRIAAAHIPVELHVYPGLPHAFELLGQGTDVVERVISNRVRAFTSI